jgi:PII-like signaling protein
MKEAILLRAFLREDDTHQGQPLYQALVLRAREMRLAGATVLRGPIGFGQSNTIHRAQLLRGSFKLPVIVEIIDSADHIDRFLPVLGELMSTGIVTLQKVNARWYGPKEAETQ